MNLHNYRIQGFISENEEIKEVYKKEIFNEPLYFNKFELFYDDDPNKERPKATLRLETPAITGEEVGFTRDSFLDILHFELEELIKEYPEVSLIITFLQPLEAVKEEKDSETPQKEKDSEIVQEEIIETVSEEIDSEVIQEEKVEIEKEEKDSEVIQEEPKEEEIIYSELEIVNFSKIDEMEKILELTINLDYPQKSIIIVGDIK